MSSEGIRILLVEGKRAGSDSLSIFLKKRWSDIVAVHSGSDALASARFRTPNLVVFDASTMRSSGIRMCKRIRQEFPDTPFIHSRSKDALENNSLGADIYLVKPFSARKLNNRVFQLLPADEQDSSIVTVGKYRLFLEKGAIDVPDKGEQQLTPKVAKLLELLMRNVDKVVSRQQIMEDVWQTTYLGDTRTLDVHIRWIRQAIESSPNDPQILITAHGVGYVFNSKT
ncbi:MAG: DNA-binding response OmpR family regulator [Cellvibrionaceae bacterium]|jgi:DNA-binding response OmpR family regulator